MLDRREFLIKSLKGTAGLFAISILPISLTACSNDERRIEENEVDVSSLVKLGTLEELEAGDFPKRIFYSTTIQDAWHEQEMEGFVYVNKNEEEGSLLIMSPICTHLSCTVGDANQEMQNNEGIRFYCPCHGGLYDEYGNNVGGPPPRPLDTFDSYIQDGNVYISVLNPIER